MRNIEKIEDTFFKNFNLSLSTVVNTGQKTSDDRRYDSCYYRSYDSNKYTDFSKLDQLSINNSVFCVFSWKGYDEDNQFKSFDVYMSYKHLEVFKNFITEVYDDLVENVDKIYLKDKINPKYEELIYTSEPMIQERQISVYPEKYVNDDGKAFNGVTIVLHESDESEQYAQTITFDSLYTIVKIMESYNLFEASRLAFIQGMIYRLFNNNGGENSSSNRSSTSGNRLQARSRIGKGSSAPRPRSITEDIEDDDDEFSEEEEETTVTKSSSVKKSPAKAKKSAPARKARTVKDDNSASLDDMIKKGEGFSLEDDDEDGEEF